MNNDFRNYAVKHLGMNSLALDKYISASDAAIRSSYISPTIIEERQLNVAQMDVFSRLMMDRIIFLGTDVNDYTANVIQAQLLYLDSADPGKDVSIYINSPGGSVYAGLGIYDTMQYISSDVATICTGMAASMAAVLLVSGTAGKRFALRPFARHDSSADGWRPGTGIRHRDYRPRDTQAEKGALPDNSRPFRTTHREGGA